MIASNNAHSATIQTDEFSLLTVMFRPWEFEEWLKWKNDCDGIPWTIQTLCDVRRKIENATHMQFSTYSILLAIQQSWGRITNRQNAWVPDLCLVNVDEVIQKIQTLFHP